MLPSGPLPDIHYISSVGKTNSMHFALCHSVDSKFKIYNLPQKNQTYLSFIN